MQTSDAMRREIAKARSAVSGPPAAPWHTKLMEPDFTPRNRPACLDFRHSDSPLVT
jgi:hypothetical protein